MKKIIARSTFILVLIPMYHSLALTNDSNEVFTSYPGQTGVDLLSGWDSFRGSKILAKCVEAGHVEVNVRNGEASYTNATDTSSLMTALSVSAEGKVGAIQGASGNISASFSRDSKIDSTSLIVAVNVIFVEQADFVVPLGQQAVLNKQIEKTSQQSALLNGALVTSDGNNNAQSSTVHLQDWAVTLAASDPAEFQKTCGDAFVSTIRKGSGIQGIYTINTHSDAEKTTIAASIGGSYGPYSGNGAAKSLVSSLETDSRVNLHYIQLGGSGTPIATDEKTFESLIQSMGKASTPATAVPFEIGLIKYSSLHGFSSPSPATVDLEEMAGQYFRLDDLDRKIDGMLLNVGSTPAETLLFDHNLSTAALKDIQDSIKADKKTIREALELCAGRPSSCVYPPALTRGDYGYRSKLPLPAGRVASWNTLQKLSKRLADLNAELEALHEDARGVGPFGPTMFEGPIKAHEREIKVLIPQVDSAKQSVDSTDDRFREWIESPSRIRCESGELNEAVCLTNRSLDNVRRSM